MSPAGPLRQGMVTVGLAIVACLAWALRDLLMLIGFSALLAYALDPIVSAFEHLPLPGRRKVPRGLAAGFVMLALVLVMGWALASAVPRLVVDIGRFVDAAPGALTRLEQDARQFVELRGWTGLLGGDGSGSDSFLAPLLRTVQSGALGFLGRLFGNMKQFVGLVLIPLLAFYLLADAEGVRSSAMRFLPGTVRPQAVRLLGAIEPGLRAYVRGQALVCLVMGSAMALVLQVLGFPVALLLGVTVALGEIIPFLGFWIAAIAIALAGFGTSPGLALSGFVAYVVVNTLIGQLVTPRLLGRQIQMHPFVVTVSVLGGSALLGPPGGILALPAAAIVRAAIEEFGPGRDDAAS